jgi:hypothetical protein
MSQPFGVYLQCYKNPMATYKCLESLRKFYPYCSVVLLSDNGYDYTEMANFFHCIYIHDSENLLLTYKDLDSGGHIVNSKKLIKRVYDAFSLCKEDYVMWLEDDVIFNGPIKDIFRHDINGYCPNRINKSILIDLKKKYPFIDENKIYRWSGHGGSVFYKKNLIKAFENEVIILDVLHNWKNYNLALDLGQDLLFSILVLLNQGTVGPYQGHADGYDKIYQSINVQHQYKYWYNKEMPNELKHLVKMQ